MTPIATTAVVAPNLVVSQPKLKINITNVYLTQNANSGLSAAKRVLLSNIGTGNLVIYPSGITITGTDASQFAVDKASVPLVIPPNQYISLRFRMQATRVGTMSATVKVVSNDYTKAVGSVYLKGLATPSGAAGPTLSDMLAFSGVNANVNRPYPAAGGTIDYESAMPLLVKAGAGPVTVQALGITAVGAINGDVWKTGWYLPGATPTKNSLFSAAAPDAVSLRPNVNGSVSFDPGPATFGLYSLFPKMSGRDAYSEDGLNTWETIPAQQRKMRFYAMLSGTNTVVPNSYVVVMESQSADGTLTRLAAMTVKNVRHASLPIGWGSNEVGTTGLAGFTSQANGVWNVTGGGTDIGGTSDAFHFAYRQMTGDGTVVARVTSLDPNNPAARAGIMVRESLLGGSKEAMVGFSQAEGTFFQSRTGFLASTTATALPDIAAPGWLKLVRTGTLITGYASPDGIAWTSVGSATLSTGSNLYVGLAVTSHDDTLLSPVQFDNVQVTPALSTARIPPAPIVLAPAGATSTIQIGAVVGDATVSARLLVDGIQVGSPVVGGAGPYTFAWNSRAVLDGTHTLSVETTDRFGVKATGKAYVTVKNPDALPDIQFTGVTQGSLLTGSVTFGAAATDDRGVSGVTFFVDGKQLGAVQTVGPFSATWNTSAVPDGWHTLTATVKDTKGQLVTTLPMKVRVANVSTPVKAEVQSVSVGARRTASVPWTSVPGLVITTGLQLPSAPRDQWGGDTGHHGTATGYFHAQKLDGRWELIDPDGNVYFESGAIDVSRNFASNTFDKFAAQFGYGDEGTANWASWVRGWLQGLGIYSASAWSEVNKLQSGGAPMNYGLVLDMMAGFARSVSGAVSGSGNVTYANDVIPVFDPRFADYCNNYFTNVLPTKYPGLNPVTDPYLVGYMTDNELPWSTSTLNNYLTLPAGDPNRNAAEAWLKTRGVTVPSVADQTAFLSYVADTYFKTTSAALRAADPNHMILGARFTATDGKQSYLYKAARPYIDVATINYYDNFTPGYSLDSYAASADLPYIVSEFYTKGVDSGLPNTSGFGLTVRTQAERGVYYQSALLSLLQSKYAVGASWLTLMDNNPGNSNAESSNTDSNKGLMTIDYPYTYADNPYKPLTDRIADIGNNIYALIRQFLGKP